MRTKFCSENLKGRENLEDLSVDGRLNIRTDLMGIWWEGVDLIQLAQRRDQWRSPVNTVINFHVP